VAVTQVAVLRPPVFAAGRAVLGAILRRQRSQGGAFIDFGAPIPADEINLTVQDARHVHVAEDPTLTQAHTLVVQDAPQAHTADNVALTQGQNLVVQDALHAHTADNIPTLPVSGAPTLDIADATHAHLADNVALTQLHVLAVDDALHAFTSDEAHVNPPEYVFVTPVADGNPLGVRGQPGYGLWRHFGSWAEHKTVWKDQNGEWHEALNPYQGGDTDTVHDQRTGTTTVTTDDNPLHLANAEVIYYGGHEYIITEEEANELIAAGFGDFVST
jgi:hypothetical protein